MPTVHSQYPEVSKIEGVKRPRYLVIIEKGEASWGAYVPDLPGCIAAAETRQKVTAFLKDAIDFHSEGLHERGEPIPLPASEGELIETDTA